MRITEKTGRVGTFGSGRDFRGPLLQVAGKVILHARRVTVVIREEVAPLWSAFLQTLHRLLPTGPPLTA